MGRRSLQASPQGIQDIKKALKRKKWSQTYIAGAVDCSRQTIWSLLQGNPTDCDVFMEVCTQLGLNWEKVAEPELPEPEQNNGSAVDALVEEVRQRIQPYIQERCGTMRVLDMSQPIELGNIYTSVNILEKLTRTRGLDLAALMQDADPEKFERFCLGDVREMRLPGLKAVKQFSKLMILGKPGAGKTTFLKHLAIQCIGGEFQGYRVPVFITLKDFAETTGQPDLLPYIDRVVPMPFDPSPTPPRRGEGLSDSPFPTREGGWGVRSSVSIREILTRGRTLILLDGLDEVRDADSSRVLRQIQEFLQQFSQNQFVITCRIAAREYTFEQFTEVEIADFDDEQIADFSGKWFRSKNDLIKAERFLEKLKEDEPIRELATNPLLLTLLCLVFEDSGSFPTNRAELYENGVDVLLKKWDVKRNIEREQVYKRLSLKRKEDLLSQIARTTFEAGNYFFKQREVERYITQYIQNLPDASTDPEALELDSAAVLKSIEAHHGLFVERARGIYSFSHLTFHEYFTARKIVASCNPYAADDPTLQMLVRHVTEKRWREVFLLTVGMLVTADILLRLMKTRIDGLLAKDEKLQQFLRWVHQKSCEVEQELNSYQLEKPPVLRVCYFSFGLALNIEPKPDFIDFGMSLFHDIIDFVRQIEPEILGTHSPLSFDEGISKTCFYALNKVCFKPKDNSNYYYIADNLNGELDDLYDQFDLDRCREREKKYFKLENLLHQLQNQLPSRDDMKVYSDWWKYKSKAWAEQLRAVMIEHRNIGHDWQFTNEQKKLLQQYYDANKLLVDCLNSDCYVSREVRQEIEETLLLPITEIVKRSGL